MNIFKRLWKRRPMIQDRVSFNDDAVTHVCRDDTERRIRWSDLAEVGILTTDEGPFLEDVFFVLLESDAKTGVIVPQLSEGTKELFERLQQLPGFDNEAAMNAMCSTSNARFVCWKRQR